MTLYDLQRPQPRIDPPTEPQWQIALMVIGIFALCGAAMYF